MMHLLSVAWPLSDVCRKTKIQAKQDGSCSYDPVEYKSMASTSLAPRSVYLECRKHVITSTSQEFLPRVHVPRSTRPIFTFPARRDHAESHRRAGEKHRLLYPLDSHGALALQLLLVPVLLLLLAVLQPRAVVRLQHAMLAAVVPFAEAAIPDDALGCVLAVLEVASDLLGCAAADGQGHVQRAFARHVVA